MCDSFSTEVMIIMHFSVSSSCFYCYHFGMFSRPCEQCSLFAIVKVRGRNTPKTNEFDVVAMYDYPGLERGDLALVKGQKVTVFDDSREYWWRARDSKG